VIVQRHFEDLKIMHENVLKARAYYVPASKRMDTLVENREKSDRIQMLNGNWKFRYYSSINDLRENFYEMGYPAEEMGEIPVPGVWQNYGYDCHQYTNIRYPFPLDPPYVPQDNPAGAYMYDFIYEADPDAPRAYLNFEGVDSCFYLWINGSYVGYSQVSHATSEFDVTDRLVNGTNRIAVLVLKWCDGSYLEDQDKFRMSGIFRDVYLLKRPEKVVFDYFTTTQISEGVAAVTVKAAFAFAETETRLTVFDAEGKRVASAELKPMVPDMEEPDYTHEGVMGVVHPHLWNPETPYLYTLVIETEHEVITDRIGIREISVRDRVVCLNGNPVKFRGVNHHDSDPVTGPVSSVQQVKTDLIMIKEHNFNAVRTSHYPSVPYLYQLCDEIGLMVMDEADNESHGTQMQYLKDHSEQNQFCRWNERIADNPEFIEPTLDRVKLCVHRDKNRPSVVIWSMGNECAYGCTFEESLKWTKVFDSTRLTHYEGAYYKSKKRKYDFSGLDLYSRMYPWLHEVNAYLENEPDKPFMMVEYAHAMGNGPGGLKEYAELIEENDLMCGGFIWEWCDHAISKGIAEDGRTIYWYGGDHGEVLHDSNFCMDGLVYPNRKAHTGLFECKQMNRPARVTAYDAKTGRIALRSQMDFMDLKEYIFIRYEYSCDGQIMKNGEFELEESIAPRRTGTLPFRLDYPDVGKCLLKLIYCSVKDGRELGFDEICLPNRDGRNQKALELFERGSEKQKIQTSEEDDAICVKGDGFSYTFSKRTGMLNGMEYKGKTLMTQPAQLNIWRAPTDNDINQKVEWYNAGYHRTLTRAYQTAWEWNKTKVTIYGKIGVLAAAVQRILDVDIVWTVAGSGEISVEMNVKKNSEFPALPRFGIRLFLNRGFEQVTYCGMGPKECYSDKKLAASYSIWADQVASMHEDYVRPQENGSRFGCDYVTLCNQDLALTAVGLKPFCFGASEYTQEELTEKAHNYELIPSGSTVLCLDYAQNGIGSNSCGPLPSEEYLFDEENFHFALKLIVGEVR